MSTPNFCFQYFYSIKDISIGGRCVCNGHAEACDLTNPNEPQKLQCQCVHNTCGTSCEYCCPGFVAKPWRPATQYSDNACERKFHREIYWGGGNSSFLTKENKLKNKNITASTFLVSNFKLTFKTFVATSLSLSIDLFS